MFIRAAHASELRTVDWLAVREMIRNASARKQHLLSRLGIVPDHLHMTLGVHQDEAPDHVALSYMNNIAFALGMQPVLMQSCFIGGFGSYDLGAVEGR